MAKIKKGETRFCELLSEAAKGFPSLWKSDGRLNLAAVARHYEKHGYKVPQATLHRDCNGVHEPSDKVIQATHAVFRIPLSLLRGETVSSELDQLLKKHPLQVLLLAQRLVELPESDRDLVLSQVEMLEDKHRQLKAAYKEANVTPIDRHRR